MRGRMSKQSVQKSVTPKPTQRNILGIILNQPEIRLYLPYYQTDINGHCPFDSKSIGKW